MTYKELLDRLLELKSKSAINEIKSFEKNVLPGDVFVCLKGTNSDGHNYASGALKRGAKFIVTEKDLGLLKAQIQVPDTRKAYAELCSLFFNNPAKELELIAITGTNGKTTTAFIIKQILEKLTNLPVGLIGTIRNEIGSLQISAKYTTPEPFELHTLLDRMKSFGCKQVVMEASSHALAQKRLEGLAFKVAGFTNLTQDHLDFHETLEKYFLAKRSLFEVAEKAVINIDDDFGQRIVSEKENLGFKNLLTFSSSNPAADLFISGRKYFSDRVTFEIRFEGELYSCEFNMPGDFSVLNATLSFGVLLLLGFAPGRIANALSLCGRVPGRAEIIYSDEQFTIMRDYAHGPDGLEKILKTLRKFPHKRLVLLFGCAGERDNTKRKEMGKIAGKFSDFVVLSSDNPRGESERLITSEAEIGLCETTTPYKIIIDRLEAINWVLKSRMPGDLILLAGKGHEDYQVLSESTQFFDEKEIVNNFLKSEGEK